jgi:hypothetical protein
MVRKTIYSIFNHVLVIHGIAIRKNTFCIQFRLFYAVVLILHTSERNIFLVKSLKGKLALLYFTELRNDSINMKSMSIHNYGY